MSQRLIDRKNIKTIIKRTKSFTARTYGLTIMRIMYGLVGVIALLILATQAITGVIQADITKATVNNLAISIMFITGILATLAVFFMCFIFKLRKIVMVSEFQNMLFASAIRNTSDYCIVLTQNNEIIYMDKTAQQLFKSSRREGFVLDDLFKEENNTEAKQNFFDAVQNQVTFKLSHTINNLQFLALLEPLKFANGFLLLRAKMQ